MSIGLEMCHILVRLAIGRDIIYPISSSRRLASPNQTEQGGVAGLYQFKRHIWGMESMVGQCYN